MYDYLKNSIELLRYYEPFALQADPRGYCVCSSFGKDSVALLEIFRQSGVKHFVQWNITGIDPPELVYFAREQCKKLDARGIGVFAPKPSVPICKMIETRGPPTRRSRFCCAELKEKRLPETKNALHSFGVRKAESVNRSKREELEIITGKSKDKIATPFEREQLFLFNDNHENRREFENCTAKGVRAINPMIY